VSELIPPGTTAPSTAYAPPPLQPVFDPALQVVCRFCGNVPAVKTTFRQHTGIIIVMKFGKVEGPFCRNCGLYAFRSTMSHTLVGGWWSWFSLIAAPITMIVNLVRRQKVAKLPPPMMTPNGRIPVDPGKPLYKRAAILGLALPVLVGGMFAAAIISDRPENQVGQCIRTISDDRVDFVSCTETNDGLVTAVVDDEDQCAADTIATVERVFAGSGDNSDGGKLFCIGVSPSS
jgi:hypothetical protein